MSPLTLPETKPLTPPKHHNENADFLVQKVQDLHKKYNILREQQQESQKNQDHIIKLLEQIIEQNCRMECTTSEMKIEFSEQLTHIPEHSHQLKKIQNQLRDLKIDKQVKSFYGNQFGRRKDQFLHKTSPQGNPPMKYENQDIPNHSFSIPEPAKTSGFDLTASDLEIAKNVQKTFQGPYSPRHHEMNQRRQMEISPHTPNQQRQQQQSHQPHQPKPTNFCVLYNIN